jgi:hypothetical protein
MGEQELYMMVEERGKDEISAQNLKKKHESLELAVDNYADTIRQLGETARQLTSEMHPESDQIAVKQSQVDKLYAGLKDLAGERRAKLDEALKLFMLHREVDDLEQWIAEREIVAGSHELGQDYDHVTVSYFFFWLNFSIHMLFTLYIYSYYGRGLKSLLVILKQPVVNVLLLSTVLLINLLTLAIVIQLLLLNGKIV